MKRFPRIALLFLTLFFLSELCLAQTDQMKLGVKKTVLPNGLIVLTCEDKTVPTVSYMTFVNAGSRDEVKPGTTGLAHVFEHMMFRGTEKFPSYYSATAPFGAETNASTGEDYTMYYVNAKEQFLDSIVQIEADRIINLPFDNETFRTELGPIKEERRRFEVDDPNGFLEGEFTQLAYTVHTYHHPVIGFEEDLEKNIQLQDGIDFKNRFYAPNHCAIVIAGNFETPVLLRLIEKYYGGWKKATYPDNTISPEPTQKKERIKNYVWKDKETSPKMKIGFHSPKLDLNNDDYCALRLLQKVLFLPSGRITERLVKDLQLVEWVWGGVGENKDPGMFTISVSLKKGKSLEEVKKVIYEELEKTKNQLVQKEELEKAVNSEKAGVLYQLDRPSSIAYFLGHYQTLVGDYEYLWKLPERFEEITPEMIQKAAQDIFIPTNRTVVTLVPKS
ncbi:MAG TPA: pitrilysin family protein [candidate division Zixibacteria bacterium]